MKMVTCTKKLRVKRLSLIILMLLSLLLFTQPVMADTVTPGPVYSLLVNVPESVIVGQPFNMTVTAKDANGNTATGYRGTVSFQSTDPGGVLPQAYTFTESDGGSHVFSVTFNSLGNRKITVTDKGTGVVGYWKFDEGSGTSAADASGQGGTGTLSGAAWSPDTPAVKFANPRSIQFDGVNDYVAAPKSEALKLTTGTVAAWFKADTDTANFHYILGDEPADGSGWSYRLIMKKDSGELYFDFITSTDYFQILSDINVNDNQWHHAAVVRNDVTKKATLYVDGLAKASIDYTGTIHNSNYPLWIGASAYNSGSYPFKGFIDDVRFYNRNLSPEEIAGLAAGGGAPFEVTSGDIAVQPPMKVSWPSEVSVGTPFSVSITALDDQGNIMTDYNRSHTFSWTWTATAPAGGANPTKPANSAVTFTNGVATVEGFILTNTQEQPTITVTGEGGWTSTSDKIIVGLFGGGSGTAEAPYIISNPYHLYNVRSYLSAHYRMVSDIDLNAAPYNTGTGWTPFPEFTGVFDGNGHAIKNLYINNNSSDSSGMALFYSSLGGRIKNLSLTDARVTGHIYVGGLVGINKYGSQVENCYVSGAINGTQWIGGIVGFNRGEVYNSYSAGSLNGDRYVGGLVGYNYYYNDANTALNGNGKIVNSYSTANVSGREDIGGLVGFSNYDSKIENCYATGRVTGQINVGGLIGSINNRLYLSGYYDRETSGMTDADRGIPKTTAQMKQRATFTGWDFTSTWGMAEGATHPYLSWQKDNQDAARPVFAAGYPKVASAGGTGLNIQVQTDEAATLYYVVLGDTATAPDANQLMAGQDGSGAVATLKGTLSLAAGVLLNDAISESTPPAGYKVYVVAKDTAGNLSDVKLATDIGAIPTKPANLAQTAKTFYSASLGWGHSTGTVAGYIVEMKQAEGAFAEAGRSLTNAFTLQNLRPATTYVFRVKAFNAEGNTSDYSNEVTVTTLAVTDAFEVTMPSAEVYLGEPFTISVRPKSGENYSNDYQGSVYFDTSDPKAKLPAPYAFNGSEGGIQTFQVTMGTPGDHKIAVLESPSGVVGHWKFDGGSGATAADDSGLGNNGTLYGPSWAAGKPGINLNNPGSLQFDGTDDSVRITKTSALKLTSGTILVWFKADANVANYRVILGDEDAAGSKMSYRLLLQQTTGKLYFDFVTDSYQRTDLQTAAAVNDNQWHHAAVVRDDANKKIYLYLDGKQLGTYTYTGAIADNDNPLWIGSSAYNNGSYPFKGTIDDVRMYNRILDAAEISRLAQGKDAAGEGAVKVIVRPVPLEAYTTGGGQVVSLKLDKNMSDPAGLHGQFSYQINGGSSGNFAGATLREGDPATIDLRVDGAAITGGKVTLSYTPGETDVTAADGTALAAFTNLPVINLDYNLRLTAPENVVAGTSFAVTLKAVDSQGEVITNFAGNKMISWGWNATASPNGKMPTKPGNGNVNFIDGVATVSGFTLTNAGEGPTTMTVTDWNGKSHSATVQVMVGPVAGFSVAASKATILSGTPLDVTVTAQDAYGNTVSGYQGTISFSSSDPGALLPGNYTFTEADAGVHTFNVTLSAAGKQRVGVADGDAGIMGYWKFDEGSGTSAGDSSGMAGTGTVNGAAWSEDKPALNFTNQGSMQFDGVNDYIGIAKGNALKLTTSAFSAWFKADTSSGSYRVLLADEPNQAGTWSYRLIIYTDGTLYFDFNSSTKPVSVSAGLAVNDNKWHHVAVVRDDAAKTLTLYLDGVQKNTTLYSGPLVNTDNPLAIGRSEYNGGSYYYKGFIDDVRIYNRTLSQAEITTLAAGNGASLMGATGDIEVAAFPQVVSGETDVTGQEITLTFSKAMADPTGKHNQFSLKVNNQERFFSVAALKGGDPTKIVLKVQGTAISGGDTAKISYAGGDVKCIDDLALIDFTDLDVANKVLFGGGSGTAADPYLVSKPEHLYNVRTSPGAYYKMVSDIDLNTAPYNSGAGWVPINNFSGVFDGNGYVIRNLYINRPSEQYVGLFGSENSGAFKNLGLTNVWVKGSSYTAGLVARLLVSGRIVNCYVSGTVEGAYNYTGGISGYSSGGVFNSYSSGVVKGGEFAGGLVGYNSGGILEGFIINCYSTADVTGTQHVGGLAGISTTSASIVQNSFATGRVIGQIKYGGILGDTYTVKELYTDYYDSETTGIYETGKGNPLSTSEMKRLNTIAGWDFTNTWAIVQGATYPYLSWQKDSQDMARPLFTSGYPATANVAETKLDLRAQTDEAATIYYVVLGSAATAPGANQVVAGQDSSGNAAALKGNFSLSAGTPSSASISGLSEATEYKIYVVAKDTAGNLSAVQTVTATTTVLDVTPPTKPMNVFATAKTSSGVNLTWENSTDDIGVAEYIVEIKQGAGTFAVAERSVTNSLNLQGLNPSSSYVFRVKALDAKGNSSGYSDEITVTTLDLDEGGLNSEAENLTPSMAVFNNEPYTAWVEKVNGITQVRIKKYNGASWGSAGSVSLNADANKGAYNPVLIQYGNSLYAAWYEESVYDQVYGQLYQVYVSEYDRQGNSWSAGENISYDFGKKAFNVKLAVYNNLLYAVWVENNGSKNQIRAKTYDGSSWNSVDGDTLNYDPAKKATLPTVAATNNGLFAAWSERGEIRVKQHNGSWQTADNHQSLSDSSKFADMPILLTDANDLYILWAERDRQTPDGDYQVRGMQYNGGSWDSIDGGSLNGSSASMLNGTVHQGTLYAAWTEGNEAKIKSYSGGGWNTVNDIKYDPAAQATTGLAFAAKGDQLYVTWKETGGAGDKIRVKLIPAP